MDGDTLQWITLAWMALAVVVHITMFLSLIHI